MANSDRDKFINDIANIPKLKLQGRLGTMQN